MAMGQAGVDMFLVGVDWMSETKLELRYCVNTGRITVRTLQNLSYHSMWPAQEIRTSYILCLISLCILEDALQFFRKKFQREKLDL